MEIRRGVAGDEKAISRIGRESFSWAFGHLYPTDVLERYLDDTYSARKLALSLSKPSNLYFVAEVEDGLVGFLKLKRFCNHPLIRCAGQVQVQKLYVLPESANLGVGSSLMRSAEAEISALLPVSAWLMVYVENRRARCFYERFGYEIIGSDTHDFEDVRVSFSVMKKTDWT
jgi:diamine N-acetyltransferase